MIGRLQKGFTLVEVLVATAVLVTLSALSLATVWRIVRNARDSADIMVADAYCQQVLFAVLSNTNLIGGCSDVSWEIDPAKGLPKIVNENLFGEVTTNCPLWRTKKEDKRPRCMIKKIKKDEKDFISGDIEWTGVDGRKCQLPQPLEVPLDPDGGAGTE